MHIEWLDTFAAVVETGSFTEAAERLLVSQPAPSKQVQQIEAFFGVPLKQWKGREFRLTPEGEEVYRFARRFRGELGNLRNDLKHGVATRANTVTIAGGPSLLYHYLPFLAESLRSAAGDIRLATVTVVEQTELVEAVIEDRADIALHTGPYSHPRPRRQPIIVDRIVCVANPRHPFARQASVTPEQLCQVRVYCLREVSESRVMVDEWFRARGLALADVIEPGTNPEVRALLLATPAVGFLPRIVVADDISAGRLVEVNVPGFPLSRLLYASCRPEVRPAVQHVLDFMVSTFEATTAEASRAIARDTNAVAAARRSDSE